MADKEVAVNRRAFHDYFVDEHYEAGIVLTGTEVKSLRAGKIQLRDGFVRIDGHEAWLENVHISPYTQGGYVNHEPMRPRQLLLHAEEISSLVASLMLPTLLPSTTTLAPMVDHSVRVQAEPPAKMSSVPPLLV